MNQIYAMFFYEIARSNFIEIKQTVSRLSMELLSKDHNIFHLSGEMYFFSRLVPYTQEGKSTLVQIPRLPIISFRFVITACTCVGQLTQWAVRLVGQPEESYDCHYLLFSHIKR